MQREDIEVTDTWYKAVQISTIGVTVHVTIPDTKAVGRCVDEIQQLPLPEENCHPE